MYVKQIMEMGGEGGREEGRGERKSERESARETTLVLEHKAGIVKRIPKEFVLDTTT